MPGLKELYEQQQKVAEREAAKGGGRNSYYPRTGDRVFFYFAWAEPGYEEYFDIFAAHAVPQGERKYDTHKYCPVESGHDENYNCQFCTGDFPIKNRMRFWMYVTSILHLKLREGETFPQVSFGNQMYYQQDVNDFRVWDTSAWRDSPKSDIIDNASMLAQNGLTMHHTMFQLSAVGESLDRRYTIIPMMGTSPMPDEVRNQIKEKCEPIRQMLMSEITAVQTAAAPTAGAQAFNPTPLIQATQAAPAAPPAAPVPQPAPPPAPANTPPATPEPEAPPTNEVPTEPAAMVPAPQPNAIPGATPAGQPAAFNPGGADPKKLW